MRNVLQAAVMRNGRGEICLSNAYGIPVVNNYKNVVFLVQHINAGGR
jgi:hypothetical protein